MPRKLPPGYMQAFFGGTTEAYNPNDMSGIVNAGRALVNSPNPLVHSSPAPQMAMPVANVGMAAPAAPQPAAPPQEAPVNRFYNPIDNGPYSESKFNSGMADRVNLPQGWAKPNQGYTASFNAPAGTPNMAPQKPSVAPKPNQAVLDRRTQALGNIQNASFSAPRVSKAEATGNINNAAKSLRKGLK